MRLRIRSAQSGGVVFLGFRQEHAELFAAVAADRVAAAALLLEQARPRS